MIRRLRMVRAQRMTIVNAMLAFVVLIVVLQLWLLTATMNAYLGGDTATVVPAAVGSLVCLGLNAGLLWYLFRPRKVTAIAGRHHRTQAGWSGRGPLPRLFRRSSWRRGLSRLPPTSCRCRASRRRYSASTSAPMWC